MRVFHLLALCASILPISALQPRDPSKTFTISVAEKPQHSRDFVRDWMAARQKWGGRIPKEAASMFSLLDDDGRVEVEPLGSDDIYIADLEFGEPPQVLKIAIDTGSSDLWVQSTDTVYRVNDNGPWAPQYQPNKSETSQPVENAIWAVRYMDGTAAQGIVYRDTVQLGSFTVENATIQSAMQVATRFERETGLSGIMGLAKNLPNNIRPFQQTFLSLLAPQLDSPYFSVDLRRNATGRFDFGFLDESRLRDNITWMDTDPESPHWDVTFDLTSWNGREKTWYFHEFKATIDTGTTLMFLPDVLASMYWFEIPGMRVDPRLDDAYTFPCNIAKNLPDLRFKIPRTQHILTVPGSFLNYGPVLGNDEGYCWGGMQSANGMDVTILGDIMLKALFVAFDIEKGKVGFANKML